LRFETRVKPCWVLVITLLLLCEARPQASHRFSIQKVDKLNEIVSLNSTNPMSEDSHRWWITRDSVDPQEYSHQLLKGAGPDNIENSTNWFPVKVPAVIEKQIDFSDSNNEFCYLKMIRLPEKITEDLMIMLGEITDRDSTYFNGVLIGSTGEWHSKYAQAYDKVRMYRVPRELIRPGENNIVLVKVQGYFPNSTGITQGKTAIGYQQAVLSRFHFQNYSKALILAFYLAVGSYFFLLFIRRRKDREYLYFATFVM